MPIYEFRCTNCDHGYEEILGLGQTALCPRCEGSAQRLISLFVTTENRPEHAPISTPSTPPRRGPRLIDNVIHNCGVGIQIGPGSHIESRGLRMKGNSTAILNEGGTFDGPDTVIE